MMKRLLALLLIAFVLGAALVGCGGGNGNGGGEPAEPEATTPAAAANPVQEFLDEHAADLEAELAPLSDMMGEGGSISIEAGRSNEMVFIFAYGPDIPLEGVADLLPDMLQGMAFVFEGLAAEIGGELGIDDFTITVVYRDSTGADLASESFQAQ